MHTVRTRIDRPQLLSILWIFLLLNFIYCDIIVLHDGGVLQDLIAGRAGALDVTPTFLLLVSLLMEIPIAMVLVSRLAARAPNRIANIAAGAFMIVVQASSLLAGGDPAASDWTYRFFSAIEIATLATIVTLAIRWKRDDHNVPRNDA
jgi:hypothetical protein